jgi:hypothetical protein
VEEENEIRVGRGNIAGIMYVMRVDIIRVVPLRG